MKKQRSKIMRNSAECKNCGNVLVSSANSALIECRCGLLAISGGSRRLERYGKKSDYIERSVLEIDFRKKV